MANIGSFKKSGLEFQGEIVTLSLQTKGVRIVPEAGPVSDNAPSHRIFVGRAEIGAAWSKRSNEGRDYLSVKLDDPSFNAPIYANLFDDEGPPFCSPDYLFLRLERGISCVGRSIAGTSPKCCSAHASTSPLIGLIWPKAGYASIA